MRQKIMLLAMVTTMSLTVMPPVYANSSMTDSDSQSESEQSVSQNESESSSETIQTESSTSEDQIISETTEVKTPPTTSQTEHTESESSLQTEEQTTSESEDALAKAVADVMRDLPKMELDPTRGPGYYEVAANSRAKRSMSTTSATAVTNTQAFLNKIKAGAISGWKKYKVLPSLTGSQAVLESGWGSSGLSTSANNLFGIKGRYNNQFELWPTAEYINGQWVTVNAEFRKYPSWKESMEDHGKFLVDNSRYAKVLGQKDYKKATQLIWEAGYATDPDYPGKLQSTIEYNNLVAWDKEAFGDVINLSEYYTTNPKYVITKKTDTSYKSAEFSSGNKAKTYVAGTVLSIKGVVYNKKGSPILQLTDGTYFTAHKSNVVKTVSNAAGYYTVNPSTVITKKTDTAYKNVNFSSSQKGKSYAKGSVLKVKGISFNKDGVPILALTDGTYFTAHKSNVFETVSNASSYHTINPTIVITKRTDDAYKSVDFSSNQKAKKHLEGSILKVKEIAYNKNGVPVLMLTDGSYFSAYKGNVVKTVNNASEYYRTNPLTVITKKTDTSYKKVDFSSNDISKTYTAGSVLKIKEIAFNKNGVPILALTDGTYFTAYKGNVFSTVSNAGSYYTINPEIVIVKKTDTSYKNPNFSKKEQMKVYNEGEIVKVKNVSFNSNNVPVLKLADGGYFTAYKGNVVKTVGTAVNYFTVNPKAVIVTKENYEYSSPEFSNGTKKEKRRVGSVLKVENIVFDSKGYPVLKLKNGNYFTAHFGSLMKTVENADMYFTELPGKKLVNKYTDYSYKTVNFSNNYRANLYDAGTEIDSIAIEYNNNGVPVFKLRNGNYFTAYKNNFKK